MLGIIGAAVAKFVARSASATWIQPSSVNLDGAMMFSALISLAAIDIVGSQIVRALHARIVFRDRPSSTVVTTEGRM
jgi:hypothetical protein